MNICFLRFHRISKALLYRPYYDNQRVWLIVADHADTYKAIQVPFTFYYKQDNDWNSTHSYQFWSMNFTVDPGVTNVQPQKTIYSPSPSGYIEPKTAAFTGFTSTGGNSNDVNLFNVSGIWNKGWHFYTNGWKTGNTIFFYALGYRNVYKNSGNGNVTGVGEVGDFWSSGASSASRARLMNVLSTNVLCQNMDFRSFGLSCRSVKE